MRGEAGLYVEATRTVETTSAVAVVVSGQMRRIDITDLQVSVAYSHSDTLRDTARQMGLKVFGKVVSYAGCFEATERRMEVPWTIECRSISPMEHLLYGSVGTAVDVYRQSAAHDDDRR